MDPEGKPSHKRIAFSHEIEGLEHDILQMASRAEIMVGQAVDAITHLDVELADKVIQADDEVDAFDSHIELRSLQLLAGQQREGNDLRMIGTILKMITDIERIADLAVDIARCARKIELEMGGSRFVDLPRIATVARLMIREAIEAYVKEDLDLIKSVAKREEEVDALYRDIREQIHEHMRSNPDEVVASSWMLLALYHIERIADHALNIAERVTLIMQENPERTQTFHWSEA